ncbi:hypothetical protein ACG2F4_10310 [Halalkalibaculum sp. DA3122]|uniref:hypothetical protein n=1 Tax=Halalkalibaculum sp. DA3122 TaxID=3373607 RepID=UPI0037550AB1
MNSKDIGVQLINGFLETELAAFNDQYREADSLSSQYRRSFSIAWVCYFLEPWVSDSFKKALSAFVSNVMDEEDYDTFGWQRIPSLQAASFLLTANEEHRDDLLKHISCGQSTVRPFMIRSAALIAPLLSFNNKYLKRAAEKNIEVIHGYYEESTVLYLCTDGDREQKKRWALTFKKKARAQQVEAFQRFFEENKDYRNTFFADEFAEAKSYFIFKLFSNPVLSKYQSAGEPFNPSENFSSLTEKENKHPLSKAHIDLSCLKKEKTGLFKEENQ